MKIQSFTIALLVGCVIGLMVVTQLLRSRIEALEIKWSQMRMTEAGWMSASWNRGPDFTVVVCTGDSIRVYDWRDYGKPKKAISR